MGCYINPKDMSKEEWICLYAVALSVSAGEWGEQPKDTLPVCIVNTGSFIVAGIAFNKEEFNEFNLPDDHLQKIWAFVPIDKLYEVAPDLKYYLPPP